MKNAVDFWTRRFSGAFCINHCTNNFHSTDDIEETFQPKQLKMQNLIPVKKVYSCFDLDKRKDVYSNRIQI